MFSLRDVSQELQSWSVQYQLEERATTTFWAYLEEYQRTESAEFAELFPQFSKDYVVIGVKEISFTMNWAVRTFSYVAVHMPVYYQGKDYGWFHVLWTAPLRPYQREREVLRTDVIYCEQQ